MAKQKDQSVDVSKVQVEAYASAYSEPQFLSKAKRFAISLGREPLSKAIQMYLVLQSDDVPLWAKLKVMGALGYFISPVDLVPDVVPVVGLLDDAGVLALAFGMVAMHITPEIKQKAEGLLDRLFSVGEGQ